MITRSLKLMPLLVLMGTDYAVAAPRQPCRPDPTLIPSLCVAVYDSARDSQGVYLHQTLIYEAACVLPTDALPERRRKIQEFWNEYLEELVCTVPPLDILKKAVESRVDRFVSDLATKWKVDLTYVDGHDHTTVLDYVQSEIERYPVGSEARLRLESYYTTLRDQRAKHSHEL